MLASKYFKKSVRYRSAYGEPNTGTDHDAANFEGNAQRTSFCESFSDTESTDSIKISRIKSGAIYKYVPK